MFDFIHARTVANFACLGISAYCGCLGRAWRLAPAVNNLMKNCIVPEEGSRIQEPSTRGEPCEEWDSGFVGFLDSLLGIVCLNFS
jgi:hypothetical protein